MTQRVGRIKGLAQSARFLRLGMNLWPPFLFSGVRVKHISDDFRTVRVRLALNPLNSNYFGTQFGGSLFAMIDAFWALMVMRNLGPGYTVWDRQAEIDFRIPGKTAVTAELVLDPETIEQIRAQAKTGDKVLHWFGCDIVDKPGNVVAHVRKQVYVRKRR